jgi:acyl-CoA thioesterase
MQANRALLAKDAYARFSGMTLEEISPGRAVAVITVAENHLNGAGMVHGGVIFTLADFAFAAAVNSHDRLTVAITAGITYLRPAAGKKLTAEATEINRSRTLAHCTVNVSDDTGKLIAVFQGTAYIKSDPIPPADAPEERA